MRKLFWIIPLLFAAFGPPNVFADTITSTPNPSSLPSGSGILMDSATLAGAISPSGIMTFTLFFDAGTTPIDTETVSVSGDGTYTTPTGYTLPTLGLVDGVYQWDVTYNGDGVNPPVSDINDPSEQVVVGPVAATPEPGTLMLVVVGLLGLVSIQRRRKLSGYLLSIP